MSQSHAPATSGSAADEHPPLPPLDRTTPQLTIRAVGTGMVLGALLSICNVYLGLKIGWGTNVSITGILLAFAMWRTIAVTLGPKAGRFTMLENNINQSACSAAAAVSSAGLVAPIPALTMMTGETLSWPVLSIWVFSVCLVGITVAAGLRRQMIVVDRLPFPSGMACAETLREIYGHGSEAIRRVAVMGGGALVAATFKFLEIQKVLVAWAFPFQVRGYSGKTLGFELEPSILMVGVGGLIGFRAAASIMLGALVAWLWIAPIAAERGWAELTGRETLLAMPAGVELPPESRLRFNAGMRTLTHMGIMSEADRDRYLAMSDDATWTAAVTKLWHENRFLPPIAPPANWRDELPLLASSVAIPKGFDVAAIPAEFSERVEVLVNADAAPIGLLIRGELTEADAAALIGTQEWPGKAAGLRAATLVAPPQAGFSDLLNWVLWPGVTLMVVSSLVSFSFSWKAILRSFTGSRGMTPEQAAALDPEVTGDLPKRWFLAGCGVALVASIVCQILFFEITWWAAGVGVLLSFLLAIVASRVSGETNITPVGAMGKVTQLVFGILIPKNAAANLMTANVTGGAASQCADLMHDFKCGSLLGASPRKQFVAQVGGAFAGSLVGSLCYLILIPDPANMLMKPDWPAPAVAAWKAVAEVFLVGLDALPAYTPHAMLIAGILGVVLPVLERVVPKRHKALVPSAASLGLAFVVAAKFAISMFIGACLAWLLSRLFPKWSTRFLVTICAGIVVGDSLVGAGDAIWKVISAGLG